MEDNHSEEANKRIESIPLEHLIRQNTTKQKHASENSHWYTVQPSENLQEDLRENDSSTKGLISPDDMALFWASMLKDSNNVPPEDLIHYWLDDSTQGSHDSSSKIITDDAGTTPHKENLDSPESIFHPHLDKSKICNDSSHGTSVQVSHSN